MWYDKVDTTRKVCRESMDLLNTCSYHGFESKIVTSMRKYFEENLKFKNNQAYHEKIRHAEDMLMFSQLLGL
jgi:hypothetical protein